MENNTKTAKQLMNEIVNNFKNDSFKNKHFLTSIINICHKLDLLCKDTNGLPFNGSTYEIYRRVDYNGHKLNETIGHFKYVYAIYGDKVYLSFYDDECVGGSALNGSESGKYIYRTEFDRKR